MTCVEEIEYFQNISTILLCVQALFVIIFLRLSKEKRQVDLFFFLGLIFLHPKWHKTISDCGEEMFHGSLLFFGTTLALVIGFFYRSSLINKIKDP